jgi:hypothetical protein
MPIDWEPGGELTLSMIVYIGLIKENAVYEIEHVELFDVFDDYGSFT